jgi:transcriptional regulator with XRE-family HTH domain
MPHRPFVRTLRAQWLGQRLRERREQRGMPLKLVAEHLGRDFSALGRYERAEWPIQRADVVALLDLYGLHAAPERARLLHIAEDIWRTHRWSFAPEEVADASFIDLPWLAALAQKICLYHPSAVPEPLRIPRYAELLIRCGGGGEAVVERRTERQRLLTDHLTKIQAVVDEAALRRPIGGDGVMRAQLRHLRGVDVRVLPADFALHPGLEGPFWLFLMPPPYPPVGYQDGLAGDLYVELPEAERFVDRYQLLLDAALDQRESAALIAALAGPGSIDGL